MDAAVYLFTGFMDSGKTSLITNTLVDAEFAEDAKSLVIVCEEGDVEYDEKKFAGVNAAVVLLESPDELSEETLKKLDEEYQPDAVFIEYNGT